MAGDWIKIENVTPDKPEIFVMAGELDIDPDSVLGKLVRLWVWANEQTFDGNAVSVTSALPDRKSIVTKMLVDRICGVNGFYDSLKRVGWIVETENGLVFPNFDRHNGQTAKTRALTAKRVAKHKAETNDEVTIEKRQGNAESVTKSLLEKSKRREESNKELASANSCSEPSPKSSELTDFVFDVTGNPNVKTWVVPKQKYDEWREAFPFLDLDKELRKAIQWVRDNPTKRKTAQGMTRFINSWLSRAQNETRSTSKPIEKPKQKMQFPTDEDVEKARRGELDYNPYADPSTLE